MIERQLTQELKKRLLAYPAVGLIGPRQCGKTTLAKSFGGAYFDLEQQADRLRLDLEWDRLMGGERLVILDEAQSWPEVFNRLRGAIDAERQRQGRFLILGSVSPTLMVHVSESLAGRLSLMELTPFLLSEFSADACDRLWFFGGYPDGGILTESHYPQWDKDYVQLLTQRDLPMWGLPAKPLTTLQLLRMLAAGHGQTWNASQVGQSMSLDYKTVNSYLGYLIGAFLIRQLQPYQANVKKRLVKSSKVYWRDSGLLHSMLNVSDIAALLDQPWVGASWEGFVIEQVLGFLATAGRHFEPYYLRTNDQYELDLVLDFGGELWAMEIKLTTSPSQRDMERLNHTADLIGATKRFLISRTREPVWGETRISCNIEGLLAYLAGAKA